MVEREDWVDIARGIGIILVVVGHMALLEIGSAREGFLERVYWFHMPLFFIISGYLFKPVAIDKLRDWINKRTFRLMAPYVTFFLLLIIPSIILFYYNLWAHDVSYPIIDYLLLDVWGGRATRGIYGVFWFITCLLFTQILFTIITSCIKNNKIVIFIVLAMYILAHAITYSLNSYLPSMLDGVFAGNIILFTLNNTPLAIGTVLITTFYYAFGYYSKNFIKNVHRFELLFFSASSILILLSVLGIFQYYLNLKYQSYNHLFLDALIPITLSLTVFGLCQIFVNYNYSHIISMIGKNTMIIMYLNLPILAFIGQLNSSIIVLIICIIIPIFLSEFVFKKHGYMRKIFLGDIA